MDTAQLEIEIKTSNKMKIKTQAKEKMWVDETGISIPVSRIRKSEKLREKEAYGLAKDAIDINESLKAFKLKIREAVNDVYSALAEENNVKKDTKGNITFFNFDRSIKVECSVSERIAFDETLIGMCKAKLNEFIDDNLTGLDTLIKELVNDAFSTTKGQLDAKKVMSLLKYRSKIKAQKFQDALDLLEKSITRPSSKQYFKVSVKGEDGGYQNVDLNFSSAE